ncbi:hypothetical protein BE21_45815 [Sorangium cellulosum]|uniref:Gp5/Type VI secretion system Vgr protein OB-fold domain-containing protein n=1 Tax=Sorangium cellulosum TaxID=56 RepID=A0A150TIS2_SORCE|nr:hypothetical protein BE21_45815 [Sorangium cellulosum]
MKDLFTIQSSALPDTTTVAAFQGSEGISRLYAFEILLLVGAEGRELDIGDVVGTRATLQVDREDGRPPFALHGVLAAFELLHETDEHSLFRATLVPQLWHLTKTRHSRIFTDMSVPEILREVLEDGGLNSGDFAFELLERYPPQEHVCQYQESNFDFITRWMEREGMYYYFRHGEAAEQLVITDNKSFQSEVDGRGVRFFALGGSDVTAGEALNTFTCKHQALTGSVRLRDYDYGRPTLDVSGSAAVSRVGLGEINVHGGRFFSPEEGKRLAAIRAEELRALEVVYRGAGGALGLRSGYRFKLREHPRAAFDMEYLAVAVEHQGNQAITDPALRALTGVEGSEGYRVEVQAIPASVQFRAESRTPWPRIYGSESGTICGPAESEYAQIDDAGRYRVKFHFDESDLKDGKASTWVRMLQPHGGSIEGWHFPLRKGTEVLFTFLGGDPDRPVIAGVVPNMLTPSPVTRSNDTTNVIQTGGRNRFELEDKAGHQRITLQTPYCNTVLRMGAPNDGHNMILRTDGSSLSLTGGISDEVVFGRKTGVFIGGKANLTIGATAELFIGATVSAKLAGSFSYNTLNVSGTEVSISETGTSLSHTSLDLKDQALALAHAGLHLTMTSFFIVS